MRKKVLLRPTAKTLYVLADDYQKHLTTLGYSKANCYAKSNHLLEFLARMELEGVTEMKSITPQHIQNHYQYLTERPNYNHGGTLGLKHTFRHMRAIQLFFDGLHAQGSIKSNPASALRFPYPKDSSVRKILTQKQIKQLYGATVNDQEKALLSLAYGCGLRAGELEQLNLDDVNQKERLVIVRKGKGNKRRVIPINSTVAIQLDNYLNNERCTNTKTSAFMLHSKGGRMRHYTWNKYLKRIALRVDIKNIVVHDLRHSIASHLIEKGVEVQQVRLFLGHSYLETTQVYTHIRNRQLKRLL